eukprot:2756857-Amphidinium_carterae.1
MWEVLSPQRKSSCNTTQVCPAEYYGCRSITSTGRILWKMNKLFSVLDGHYPRLWLCAVQQLVSGLNLTLTALCIPYFLLRA